MATLPDSGSDAPNTQPSWWLPRTTHSSGFSLALHGGDDVVDGFSDQSDLTIRWTFTAPSPPVW
jgi:hypothetical protein